MTLPTLRVPMRVALLILGLAAAPATAQDLTGDYLVTVDAITSQGLPCHFEGTGQLVQDVGGAITGSADVKETTGELTCPSMPSASAQGSVSGSNVTLQWVGQDGQGDSDGTISHGGLAHGGPVVVTAGPFTSMTGTYQAVRVIPQIAGSWRFEAQVQVGTSGCLYRGSGSFQQDVELLVGSVDLKMVSGDPGACPEMPGAQADGTIDPNGSLSVQLSGPDGSGSFTGAAAPDGRSASGDFTASSGPYQGATGTLTGNQVGLAVPSLTRISVALLLAALLLVGTVAARRGSRMRAA